MNCLVGAGRAALPMFRQVSRIQPVVPPIYCLPSATLFKYSSKKKVGQSKPPMDYVAHLQNYTTVSQLSNLLAKRPVSRKAIPMGLLLAMVEKVPRLHNQPHRTDFFRQLLHKIENLSEEPNEKDLARILSAGARLFLQIPAEEETIAQLLQPFLRPAFNSIVKAVPGESYSERRIRADTLSTLISAYRALGLVNANKGDLFQATNRLVTVFESEELVIAVESLAVAQTFTAEFVESVSEYSIAKSDLYSTGELIRLILALKQMNASRNTLISLASSLVPFLGEIQRPTLRILWFALRGVEDQLHYRLQTAILKIHSQHQELAEETAQEAADEIISAKGQRETADEEEEEEDDGEEVDDEENKGPEEEVELDQEELIPDLSSNTIFVDPEPVARPANSEWTRFEAQMFSKFPVSHFISPIYHSQYEKK